MAYTGLVVIVAVLRLLELRVSNRNIGRLKARGAVEVGFEHWPWMVVVHATWLVACVVEVWWLGRPWIPALGIFAACVFLAGMALRYWTVASLGGRWSTRVVFVASDPLETGGPFRWLCHPNYLGVVLEIVALPMIHTAWLTAAVFSVANAVVLGRRLAVEGVALADRGKNDAAGSERHGAALGGR